MGVVTGHCALDRIVDTGAGLLVTCGSLRSQGKVDFHEEISVHFTGFPSDFVCRVLVWQFDSIVRQFKYLWEQYFIGRPLRSIFE